MFTNPLHPHLGGIRIPRMIRASGFGGEFNTRGMGLFPQMLLTFCAIFCNQILVQLGGHLKLQAVATVANKTKIKAQ